MKHIILITFSFFIFAFSLNAAKPDNAGKTDKQKTIQNQPDVHHSDSDVAKSKEKKEKKEKEAKQHDDDAEESKDKANRSNKTDVERKEAGKGSETGQEQREAHSRKWWKFWGENED